MLKNEDTIEISFATKRVQRPTWAYTAHGNARATGRKFGETRQLITALFRRDNGVVHIRDQNGVYKVEGNEWAIKEWFSKEVAKADGTDTTVVCPFPLSKVSV